MRHTLSLIVVAGCCLVVGAQSTPTLTSQKRAELFKKNKVVIEKMVDKAVESAHTANDHLKRADSYYKVLYQFNVEITKAREAKDDARAKELTEHLATLLDRGLKPTLEQAHLQLKDGTGADEFPKIKDQLLKQLDALLVTLPDDANAQQSLSGVRTRLLNVGQ